MNTIKTFIPSESVDAFKKFADKTRKNVKYSTGCLRKANDTERYHLLGIMKDKGYSYDFKKNKLLHSFNYEKRRN